MSYYGANLSRAFYELRMLKVPFDFRSDEPDMYDRKWYSYRTMHPTEATYLWTHYYNEHARLHHSKTKDTDTAHEISGIYEADVFTSKEITSVWWARRSFDSIGVPYDRAIAFLVRRAIDRGHFTMPRPNQLYSMDCMIDLKNWWDDKLKTELTFSDAEFYKAVNFAEHPYQIEHLKDLSEQVSKRAKPRYRVVARLFKEGLLNDALAQRFFPDEASQAQEYFFSVLSK